MASRKLTLADMMKGIQEKETRPPGSQTATELADEMKISKAKAIRYIEMLMAEGRIGFQDITGNRGGRVRVYWVKDSG